MPTARRKPREPNQDSAAVASVKPSKVVHLASKREVRRRNSLGEEVVRGFATSIESELRAKHVAGRPYSTLNTNGEVVFIHPDGSVRVGRATPAARVPASIGRC